MIKGPILQEDIKVCNVRVLNKSALNFMRQKLIELQDNNNDNNNNEFTIIVRNFNTSLLEMGISSRQKISKDIAGLNNTVNQLNIINIYRLRYPTTAEYTFLLKLTCNIHQDTTSWIIKYTYSTARC